MQQPRVARSAARLPPVALDEVILTPELDRRPARAPDAQAENVALHALARKLGDTPQELLESLVAFARDLCQAGSAGVSVLVDGRSGEQIIRWEAVAGDWAGYVGTSGRAEISPSGPCLASGSAQLYAYPARHFTYLGELRPPLVEALFIPFSTPEGPLGTIWVAAHDEHRKFDAEDVRILTSLAGFMAHGDHIWAESAGENQGTTFRFTLPKGATVE